MVLEKQMLFRVNVGRLIKPFPNSSLGVLQRERLLTCGKLSRPLPVFPEVDVLANLHRRQNVHESTITAVPEQTTTSSATRSFGQLAPKWSCLGSMNQHHVWWKPNSCVSLCCGGTLRELRTSKYPKTPTEAMLYRRMDQKIPPQPS